MALGWVSLALALIGIVLPIMPTVPFLLVAVWAFSRASPRISARIMRHPTFGPQMRAWRKRGVIGRLPKIWAILAMACGVGWSTWLGISPWLITFQALGCLAVAIWLITRPEV